MTPDRAYPPPAGADARTLAIREAALARMRADPLRFGFEPDIWQVAWALLDAPRTGDVFLSRLRRRWGHAEPDPWGRFKREMRAALGFGRPVRDLLVMGANRAGKTDFAAKTLMRLAASKPRALCFFLAQQLTVSAETVQPRMWRYFPPDLKTKHLGEDWYVHYKELTGFTGAAFQLPNGTKVLGKFYSQDPSNALVGSEADFAWADELVPQNWVDELGRRLASRRNRSLKRPNRNLNRQSRPSRRSRRNRRSPRRSRKPFNLSTLQPFNRRRSRQPSPRTRPGRSPSRRPRPPPPPGRRPPRRRPRPRPSRRFCRSRRRRHRSSRQPRKTRNFRRNRLRKLRKMV